MLLTMVIEDIFYAFEYKKLNYYVCFVKQIEYFVCFVSDVVSPG